MKKTSIRKLILLLPVLAVMAGLAALPAVCPAEEELTVMMSVDKEKIIQVGDSVTVTVTPSGGTPPYTYRHFMSIDELGEDHFFATENTSDNSHTWTVEFGETVWLKSLVWDKNGKRGACETTLAVMGSVHNPIIITGESISPGNVINIGDTITYSVVVQGGQPPYTYEYKLSLYQDDCWIVPEDGNSVFDTNSFSYTITRGDKGDFFSSVRDALGRQVYTDTPVEFTILGDDHAPMDLSATHRLVKLSKNKYQLTIQPSVKGGTRPVEYICRWDLSKNGKSIGHDIYRNTEGTFTFEGDFDKAYAYIYAIDADGWNSEDHLELHFDAKDAVRPFRTDLIKRNPREISLREDLRYPDRKSLIDQLHDIPEPVPTVIPIRDLTKPELVNPELTKPLPTNPELIKPKLTNPELTKPGLTVPEIPVIRPPRLPGQ